MFAFLPLGTANSFARTLGIPLDLDGAVDVIAKGEARRIDVGCIDGDYFLNAAAIGLSPMSRGNGAARAQAQARAARLSRLGRVVGGRNSALSASSWTTASARDRMWATEVRIANGRFHGGLELVENADLDSGEIVVQAVTGRERRSGSDGAGLASAMKLRSRHETVREFHVRQASNSTTGPG